MTDTGTEGMTQYELAYLVTPLLPQANLDEEVAGMKRGIEAAGGVVVSQEAPKDEVKEEAGDAGVAGKEVLSAPLSDQELDREIDQMIAA